jgi:membrane fusion protein (multidrug efflux system)
MKLDDTKNKIIATFISIATILAGYLTYEHFSYVTTDNAQIFGHSLMLGPKVSGYITAVNVVEGQKVKKGDVLISIDPRDYDNNLKQAKGELAMTDLSPLSSKSDILSSLCSWILSCFLICSY